MITPGPRTITSQWSRLFDTGLFMGISVPLGESQTDANGRLLVLGEFAGETAKDSNTESSGGKVERQPLARFNPAIRQNAAQLAR
jgi:hypothetical protein